MDAENKNFVDDALVMVHLRNGFYREKFQFTLGLYLASIIANLVLIWTIVYLVRNPTQPLYFPADKLGRLIKVIPLQETNMSTDEVAAWTMLAVETANSFDFKNYREQLQNAQKYFTDYGWRNYVKALTASNNLKAVTNRKYIALAKVVDKPTLLNYGNLAGAQAWKFEMHMLVTYMSPPFDDKSSFSIPVIVTVTVQRQNVLQSYKGLGIVQYIGIPAVSKNDKG